VTPVCQVQNFFSVTQYRIKKITHKSLQVLAAQISGQGTQLCRPFRKRRKMMQ
jgi:hypothetical protein